jgi:2-polyprenyl-6-methoxyphenol hydroxylase-like FAD-dependent oxidoreductase
MKELEAMPVLRTFDRPPLGGVRVSRVLIAGGGIGGLAAALSVSRYGPKVRVFERRDEFSESGAGIQLGPNAFRALRVLGLNEAVCGRAVFVDELRVMDGTTGRPLLRLPVKGSYVTRFREPYAVVHRGELYRVLLDACRASGRVELSASTEITGYEQDDTSVRALARDGRRFDGCVLIGADGIKSNVREQIVGDGSPRVSGHTIYRSVIAMDDVPARLRSDTVTLWAGPGWHFVHYPIAGGSRLNLAATRDDQATGEIVGQRVDQAHVRREFAELRGVPGELIELGVDWRRWVLCDRDPVDTWVDGRAALLGDAAHPMLQYAAQGACMALEDAVVLGRCLGDHEAGPALQAYNRARRARVAKIQIVSRRLGEEIYHAQGAKAVARDRLLAQIGTDDLHARIAWLHGAQRFDESA